jgi:hypothetical protein
MFFPDTVPYEVSSDLIYIHVGLAADVQLYYAIASKYWTLRRAVSSIFKHLEWIVL